jgi:heme-degrading monooxygenase HmoA
MTNASGRAKFARIWRGRTVKAKADEYERYLLQNGIAPLEAKGAVGVQMLREDRETETEFVTISYWESVEAMTGGSGADPRLAHHLERDAEFLIELPRAVQILTILATHGASARS